MKLEIKEAKYIKRLSGKNITIRVTCENEVHYVPIDPLDEEDIYYKEIKRQVDAGLKIKEAD